MRLATLHTPAGLRLHVRGRGGYVDVAGATGDPALASLSGLLAGGRAALAAVAPLTEEPGQEFDPAGFAPAVPDARRVFCVGVNYREHATEGGRPVPTWPETFLRTASSLTGPYADLVRPAFTRLFDFEGELGVVIGSGGRYLRAEDALAAVFGYVVVNDGTARDWQRVSTQWTPGKNFDSTMPIGPEVVTTDEVDPTSLQLTTKLNGEVMQSASTGEMLVDVARCIEYFSSFTRLLPGDVIATGTPGGVGYARTPPVWLQPGDVVEVEVAGVGLIRNQVRAETEGPATWPWMPPAGTSPMPRETVR